MIAGQRLVGSNGKEVMLFPLPTMNISQGEGGSYSHAGTLNIDFVGTTTQAPYYAPCSCRCVYAGGVDHIRGFQSTAQVNRADGSVGVVSFLVMHDDNPIANEGDTFTQGDLIGHTGTAGNVTGDHVHFNTAFGIWSGMHQVPPDNQWELIGSSHIYDTCYVNDTSLINDYGYPWKTYGGVTPRSKKEKFKWILYTNKLRNERNRSY